MSDECSLDPELSALRVEVLHLMVLSIYIGVDWTDRTNKLPFIHFVSVTTISPEP